MAEWNPVSTLETLAPSNGGIVVLWCSANIMDKQEWKTSGTYGEDLFYYFIVPAGFVMTGENEFTYNFGLKYVKKSESVSGYVNHSGQRWLQEGKTASFWHLEQASPDKVTLKTDEKTKLPYLDVPSRGLPGFLPEARFFIPVPEVA